jgi:hypothetical protein
MGEQLTVPQAKRRLLSKVTFCVLSLAGHHLLFTASNNLFDTSESRLTGREVTLYSYIKMDCVPGINNGEPWLQSGREGARHSCILKVHNSIRRMEGVDTCAHSPSEIISAARSCGKNSLRATANKWTGIIGIETGSFPPQHTTRPVEG